MTGLDAKKQTAEVKAMLDLAKCNAAEIKTLNEIVTAISSKMNIPVPVSPHVAPGSPSPPPPRPPPISNRGEGNGGGGNGGNGALDSLLRGGGNLYSVRDKPMPEAIIELRRGMIGLDAKKQTTEMKDMLDLARCNAAKMKTLKEIVTAISIKMNIPVPVSPHVAHGSPSPPLAPPPPISNRGGCNSGNGDL
ncbi:hypothetical protein LOK49_LG01G01655 [Camellia lanceoleosa]|uniref:Uncharacterized protein n=1 Tax=Camellia lanceoleosa TaxID=1840588 RepID=A0ACC0J243_9ERIC|nr:hypothetical protein LOK49_LG01G01655 [Camellia lanceoleosa]